MRVVALRRSTVSLSHHAAVPVRNTNVVAMSAARAARLTV